MWLLMGIALGAGLLFLVIWLRSRGIRLAWYEWVTGILGVTLMLFTLQNYQASLKEYEPTAPGMFLLVFGIPALVFILVTALLVWFRAKKSKVALKALESQ